MQEDLNSLPNPQLKDRHELAAGVEKGIYESLRTEFLQQHYSICTIFYVAHEELSLIVITSCHELSIKVYFLYYSKLQLWLLNTDFIFYFTPTLQNSAFA
jgi:hypothetical protein